MTPASATATRIEIMKKIAWVTEVAGMISHVHSESFRWIFLSALFIPFFMSFFRSFIFLRLFIDHDPFGDDLGDERSHFIKQGLILLRGVDKSFDLKFELVLPGSRLEPLGTSVFFFRHDEKVEVAVLMPFSSGKGAEERDMGWLRFVDDPVDDIPYCGMVLFVQFVASFAKFTHRKGSSVSFFDYIGIFLVSQ